MRIEHIVAGVAEQMAGHLLRRALLAVVIGALAIVAIYHVTCAGMLALEAQYSTLVADLIGGAIYGTLARAGCIGWRLQGRVARSSEPTLAHTRELQLVMLVEAAMLGYALARKGGQA